MGGKKTALALSATGMVGRALTAALIKDGWKVYGAARLRDEDKRREIEAKGLDLIRFDVTKDNSSKLPDADASKMIESFGEPTVSLDELFDRVVADMKKG